MLVTADPLMDDAAKTAVAVISDMHKADSRAEIDQRGEQSREAVELFALATEQLRR